MKKFLYIENDSEERSRDDLDRLLDMVELLFPTLEPSEDSIQTVYRFADIPKRMQIIYNGVEAGQIILTSSVYTYNGITNSYNQTINALVSIGRNDLRNIMYLNINNLLIKRINLDSFDWLKGNEILNLIRSIETNYICYFDQRRIYRIRFIPESSKFVSEPIEITDELLRTVTSKKGQ